MSGAETLSAPATRASARRALDPGWWGLAPALLLVGVTIVAPVIALAWTSLGPGDAPFAHYARILASPAYRVPLVNTFTIAALVTAGCVILAYPVAYLMATLEPVPARIVTLVVLLPFWTSALVRTTAWIILLQRRGILNTALTQAGIVDQPVAFVYNLSGVLIGMIHVLMPFVVLPLWASFRALDRNLVRAAESLGARPSSVFRHVIGPLTAPGVVAGAIIVFMNALGFYLTPALLGGPGQTMIAMMIQFHLQERLDWGMAAALSVTLLAMTLVVFALFQRAFGIDRLWGGAAGVEGADTLAAGGEYHRGAAGRVMVGLGLLVAAFLIAPIVLVFPMSFSHSPFLVFPPPSYSARWYANLVATPKWGEALANSLVVAAIAVPLATVLGGAAAIGITRIAARWRGLVEAVLVLPLVVPAIVFAVALYYLFAPIGLANSLVGLALGHAVLGLPFVVLTVRASLRGFDDNLERAATSLGASWPVMAREILLPHLAPGIAAGAMFAFITSFDEVILAIFLTDVRSRTLPKLMYEGVAHEIDPTVTAVAALLILASVALFLASLLRGRRR